MKKSFIIIFILLVLLAIFILPILPTISLFLNTKGISNLGTTVDNDYNNRLCTGIEGLVQVGDHLYYNYARNYYNYGTFVLSEDGKKRIDWSGYDLLEDEVEVNPIRKYQNQLVIFREEEGARGYFPNEDIFVDIKIPYESFNFQEVGDVIYYTGHPSGDFKLYAIKDGERRLIVDKEVSRFYCYQDVIYYITLNKSSERLELRTYNIANKEDSLFSNVNRGVFNFLIEDDCILIARNQSVAMIDSKQEPPKAKEECIFSGERVEAINAWNGKVYICTQNGLLQYDIKSKTTIKLSDQEVKCCFIVDDHWVYFVGKNSSLWRVSQEGSNPEKVFG